VSPAEEPNGDEDDDEVAVLDEGVLREEGGRLLDTFAIMSAISHCNGVL
jgi:hypothetical protein